MYKIKYKVIHIAFIGILLGIGNAFLFVNPYHEQTTFMEIILQLSGSRGELALGYNITALLNFSIRLFPTFIFELCVGTELYHYFCTASVYIFSRTANRLEWYRHEIIGVTLISFAYEFIFIISAMLTTMVRYQVDVDLAGLIICIYHLVLYSLWMCSVTILVNLLAIYLGSDTSFLILAGIQFVLISLLSFIRFYLDNPNAITIFISLNPISHLVLGWHRSHFKMLDIAIRSPYNGFYLWVSLLLVIIFYVVCVLVGRYLIKNHDFLISNTGMEA